MLSLKELEDTLSEFLSNKGVSYDAVLVNKILPGIWSQRTVEGKLGEIRYLMEQYKSATTSHRREYLNKEILWREQKLCEIIGQPKHNIPKQADDEDALDKLIRSVRFSSEHSQSMSDSPKQNSNSPRQKKTKVERARESFIAQLHKDELQFEAESFRPRLVRRRRYSLNEN